MQLKLQMVQVYLLLCRCHKSRPSPVFTTAAGNLANAFNSVASTNAGATDPDGDTITHSITSGSLPSGLSLNSTNGAITGTPSGSSAGNYAITVQACYIWCHSHKKFCCSSCNSTVRWIYSRY